MPFFHSGGERLYYEDTGGPGPPVLFSHGFLLDRDFWEPQVSALRDGFRCLTWDQRGHGMSECSGPFDFYDAAGDGVALLDHLGLERAAWVGLSQGGFLAMRAAWKHPSRVSALVLVNTAAAAFPDEVLAAWRESERAWLEQGPVDELARPMADLLFGPDVDASGWIVRWRAKPPSAWREPWRTVLGRDAFDARLPEIRQPSLVIHGEDDQAFDLPTAEGLRDGLGACEGLLRVKGARHAPSWTHPEQVNGPLRDFLERHAQEEPR